LAARYFYIRGIRGPLKPSGNEHNSTQSIINSLFTTQTNRHRFFKMKLSILLALLPVTLALPAPVIVPRAGSPIPGRYIVKMKNEGLQNLIDAALKLLRKDPEHVYKFGEFSGFAADMADDIVELLRKLPGVSF
jgi:hypothetical protein